MQIIDIVYQLKIIGISVLLGCFFCSMYVIIKSGRIAFYVGIKNTFLRCISSIFAIHILDFLFMILLSLSFVIFIYYFNCGRFRWYLLFGMLFGYWASKYSLGIIFECVITRIFSLIKHIIVFTLRIIFMPIYKIFVLLLRPIAILYRRIINEVYTDFVNRKLISKFKI